jgi:acyl carrier protein
MIDVPKLLFEICEDKKVFDENIDLVESGLLDSFAFIELFSRLEDYNINIQPTRIDRNKLRSIKGIEELIEEYKNDNK